MQISETTACVLNVKSGWVRFPGGCRADRIWQVWCVAAHSPVSWNTILHCLRLPPTARVHVFTCVCVCVCVCMFAPCCVVVVSPGTILLPRGMHPGVDPHQSICTYTSTGESHGLGRYGCSRENLCTERHIHMQPSSTIQNWFDTCTYVSRMRELHACSDRIVEIVLCAKARLRS